jgi:acetyl esterase/lipase
MQRSIAIALFTLFAAAAAAAQQAPTSAAPDANASPLTLRLWEGAAPGAQGDQPGDIPSITVYRPAREKSSGAAFIVCPGGGYGGLAAHEGKPVAEWLNSLGITGVVLKYRLGPKYHHPVEIGDLSRALRTTRARAKEWGVDPHRVGVIGFSAGGHLASTGATHFDEGNAKSDDLIERESSRPDLAILVYPVISMEEPNVHGGSRRNLLGDHPDPKLMELLSNQKQVTAKTPPCFLVHGSDDKVVAVQNSLEFALACARNHVPFELHVFEHGPHGFGLGGNDPILSTWPADAARWLSKHGFTQ